MVHNGIEYGDMQMICETYQMMKEGLGMTNDEMHKAFAEWNKGELDSYLIEITRDIVPIRMRKAMKSSILSSTPQARRVPANGQPSLPSTLASL